MSPQEILGLTMMGALLFGIFVGFPVAFTLLLLASFFGYLGLGSKVFYLIVLQTLQTMKEESLAAVPLFIFMGHILERSGLMERLFRSFQYILGGLRGSLYLGVILTCTIFATATGIIGASVTVIGMMAAPAMMKSRYNTSLSAGSIAAGGCLGILIPPSVMLVCMGPVLGVSVIHLYGAAVIPGLILSGLYIGYVMVRCYLNPELGPPLPLEERPTSWIQIIKEFITGMLPASCIIFTALGTILLGMATPTEASAMGAAGAVLLTALYGRLNFKMIREASLNTLVTSSLILFILVTSNIFGAVFTRLGTGTLLAKTMLGLNLSPMGFLALLLVLVFVLGWPLEWAPIIFIFIPIFLPMIQEMKINLVWFGTLLAVNLQTAFLSPPVAMAAYYLKGVAPEWELLDIYKGMFHFMILQVIGLAIVFFFPQTALWLPKVLFP